MSTGGGGGGLAARLRRDLGTLESYAGLIGILVGAGIFRVTNDAWARTGPSVILGEVVLALVVLATMLPYAAYVSSPLGELPGGEYTHLSATLGGRRLAFVGAWLKMISYLGALAFLARVGADYLVELLRVLSGGGGPGGDTFERYRMPIALGSLVLFYAIHVLGVRWFGRIQVTMCAVLGVSLVVLVVPGLFAIRRSNYVPFFSRGALGFCEALPFLFFQFAGFEAMIHSAGEVMDSTRRLPRIFLRGLGATTLVYILMSLVSFGVLPGDRLRTSAAPMTEVAAVYLPAGAAALVTLGAVMAVLTSLNATFLVPSRLGLMLAEDGLVPQWMGAVSARTGTPILGLTATLGVSVGMLLSGQLSLALNIAVFALVLLYFFHSVAFLLLPWLNPTLHGSMRLRPSRPVHLGVTGLSVAALGVLIVVQVVGDVAVLGRTTFIERCLGQSLTSVELAVAWSAVGLVLYGLGRRLGADPAEAAVRLARPQ
jgi:APA family basic amino acid/polyamine antiporter